MIDNEQLNQIAPLIEEVADVSLKIATFNLFNYLEPPFAFYDFERIYSIEQWQKKQRWITHYLQQHKPDVIGFQEVFSVQSLKALVAQCGFPYFAVVDEMRVVDDYICRDPVVAIASRYPIKQVEAVVADPKISEEMGLHREFSFSRKVLRATLDLPHIGDCDCYVVHFKSKRPMLEFTEDNTLSLEKNRVEQFKMQIAGEWGSTMQRGSEAALLFIEMIARKETTGNAMLLIGDFNNSLKDGVLNHLLSHSLRVGSQTDSARYIGQYCLWDAWDLFQASAENNRHIVRPPTHYYGEISSVLDYILLSCEFNASYQHSIFAVTDYHTYNRHLINPSFEYDGESTDHGVVMVTLTLRS
ncbi:endonuclease/exonuclease/phosphatase family protein [Psychromonas sp. MME2]|uniref:endonuclease/exonuclease/phosphatase family protein n=1 Tax=unclassified Psychromonas TaxID=2614957 RepID=UPI00339C594F